MTIANNKHFVFGTATIGSSTIETNSRIGRKKQREDFHNDDDGRNNNNSNDKMTEENRNQTNDTISDDDEALVTTRSCGNLTRGSHSGTSRSST